MGGGVLEATEGQVVALECRTEGGHPGPVLSWNTPWQGEEAGAGIEFTARAALTGRTLSCTSRQGELYTSSLSLLVVVHPPPQHLHSFLSPSSASTVAILTILVSSVLLVLVLLLIIKLQKKSRRRPNLCSSSYASPLPLGSGLSPCLTHVSTA